MIFTDRKSFVKYILSVLLFGSNGIVASEIGMSSYEIVFLRTLLGSVLFIIFVLGLVNTGLGCYLYFSSMSMLPVQSVAVCGYIEPLSAVILSVFFLNEPMTAAKAVGTVLIIGGAMFGELVKPKKKWGCDETVQRKSESKHKKIVQTARFSGIIVIDEKTKTRD